MTLTPEQFNKIALKEDLVTSEEKIRGEIREFKDEILGAIDGLTKKVTISDEEKISNLAAHDRFENRITKLELKST